MGTVLGGALGAAGGHLIGGEYDRLAKGEGSREEAVTAAECARSDPATAVDVADAETANLNNDGYVTVDELVAMENAGLSNDEMLSRLRATDQVFALPQEQKQRLVEAGVSESVVDQLENINRDQRQRLFGEGEGAGVISEPHGPGGSRSGASVHLVRDGDGDGDGGASVRQWIEADQRALGVRTAGTVYRSL